MRKPKEIVLSIVNLILALQYPALLLLSLFCFLSNLELTASESNECQHHSYKGNVRLNMKVFDCHTEVDDVGKWWAIYPQAKVCCS